MAHLATADREAGKMIDLYYWTTSNGHKIMIFMEESGLPVHVIPVDIRRGDQFKPDFLAISPNNRIPAIVDHEPPDGRAPVSLFESGAILLYLANKTGRFIGEQDREGWEILPWLFWQASGQGPMTGEYYHYSLYAKEKLPYAIDRYAKEIRRLLGVLDGRLANQEFIAGQYSIADMACFPWINSYAKQGHSLADFANVARWSEAMRARPAVERAYRRADAINVQPTVTEESRAVLFGQTERRQ
jgi:GSH-dependent disulfide-bond oxidoreductase